jgi:cell division septal protein FtsQ
MQKYIKYDGLMEAIRSDLVKGKKTWLISFLLIIIICLFTGYIVFKKISSYPIKERFLLKVNSNYPIKQESDLVTKAFWEVDLHQLRQELLSSNLIKKVEVKLVIPNNLYINLLPRVGLALWWDYKKFYLIDKEGIILEEVQNKDKGKLLVVGTGALEEFETIQTLLEATSLAKEIVSIRFIGKRRWDLLLQQGTLIKLPEKNIKKALELLIKLNKKGLIAGHNLVDMRLAPKKIFIKNV